MSVLLMKVQRNHIRKGETVWEFLTKKAFKSEDDKVDEKLLAMYKGLRKDMWKKIEALPWRWAEDRIFELGRQSPFECLVI